MMWKTNRYAYASALPAIAAALALSSTPAWSQEATPPTTEPEPIAIAPPPPTDTAPATTDTANETDSTPVVDTVAETTTAAPVKPKAKPATTKAVRTAAVKKPAAAVEDKSPAPPAETAMAATAAAAPIVDARPLETVQAAPEPQASKPELKVDETAIMLGGGALALLALGGAGVALARRRRDEDEEVMEETVADEPMTIEPERLPRHDTVHDEQPAIVAPSAFAWGNAQPAEQQVDRREGETWVERAYRGPTPDNPSLSLRKRLKRAN